MGNNSFKAQHERLDPQTQEKITMDIIEDIKNNTKFTTDEVFKIISRFIALQPDQEKVKLN
jgi:hypothetical protein